MGGVVLLMLLFDESTFPPRFAFWSMWGRGFEKDSSMVSAREPGSKTEAGAAREGMLAVSWRDLTKAVVREEGKVGYDGEVKGIKSERER
jgi:hypothetical protein